jgi:hypothetical protein
MATIKKTVITLIFALILAVTAADALPACGTVKTAVTSSSSTAIVNTADIPDYSKADGQILSSAYIDYVTMKQNASSDTARQKLVTKLKTESGVTNAVLGADGTSIFVDYTDGYESIVDTYNPPLETQAAADLPDDVASDILDVNNANLEGTQSFRLVSDTQSIAGATNYIPQEKKVLILAPIGPEGRYSDGLTNVPLDCYNYFTAHGWTTDDITLAMNTATMDDWQSKTVKDIAGALKVTPDNYYHFADYGIILFFGHGCVSDFKPDEKETYLQFANVTKQTFDNDAQLKQWAQNKQIDIRGTKQSVDGNTTLYSLYIRADLLQQIMGKLPHSYIQLATCWGSYFGSAFIADGAGVFMSWDWSIAASVADKNQKNMVKLMLGSNLSAADAFNDNSVTRVLSVEEADKLQGFVPKPINFKFTAWDTSGNYYFLAWFSVTITGIPGGFPYVQVYIEKSGGEFGWYWGKTKIPCQPQIQITSANMGNKLFVAGSGQLSIMVCPRPASSDYNPAVVAKQFTAAMSPGGNNITVDFTQGGTQVNPGSIPVDTANN